MRSCNYICHWLKCPFGSRFLNDIPQRYKQETYFWNNSLLIS
jgi:hypothetical protein